MSFLNQFRRWILLLLFTWQCRVSLHQQLEPTSSRFIAKSPFKIIVRSSGSSFNSTCLANNETTKLEWVRPPRPTPDEDEYYTRRKVIPISQRIYSSSSFDGKNSWSYLAINQMSYLDTGFYSCRRVGDVKILRRQFLFVEDPHYLILPPAMQPVPPNFDLRVVGYYSEANVSIGCGSTNPNVTVVLKKHVEEGTRALVIASSTDIDTPDSDWTYDPFEGFKIKSVDSWEMKEQHECEATSKITKASYRTQKFKIDIQGVQIVPLDETTPIVEGDEVILTCRSKTKDMVQYSWRWLPLHPKITTNDWLDINETRLPVDGKGYMFPFENDTSPQEYPPLGTFEVHRLHWEHIPIEASGTYQCYDAKNPKSPASYVIVKILNSTAPILDRSQTTDEVVAQRGDEVFLTCRDTVGLPKPKVQWFRTIEKNQEEITHDQKKHYLINTTADNTSLTSVLTINWASSNAIFKCNFSNWGGEDQQFFSLTVRGVSGGIIAAIIVATLIVIVLLVLFGVFIKTTYKQKKILQKLINNRLKLLEGNSERINPDAPIEDQLELLPYDSKYEFPIGQLELGKQLGAGQFGRVVQAKASGMVNSTVAVKMVKSQVDDTALSSLASELKILIHLGKHFNVVNLLGACTKDLVKGELLVIVEFCRYGNLHDFLLAHRSCFVSELDDEGNPKNVCEKENPSSLKLFQQSSSFDNDDSSNNKPEEDSESNRSWLARKESKTRSPFVCTHDLMSWAFQIACGMNYLTKRKVLHGDLAARNVLLADDDVVKIADFGLSRQVYKDSNYQKQGNEALPVKWMAIESLVDRAFSTKSDVWSYGITIWEIFSLGKLPYPELEQISDLIRMLSTGYRMDKPECAPKAIGEILIKCWMQNPDERIAFDQLEQTLGEMVDPSIQEQFAGINFPETQDKNAEEAEDDEGGLNYIDMNTEEPMTDYLDMNNSMEVTVVPKKTPNKLLTQLSLQFINPNATPPFQSPTISKFGDKDFMNMSTTSIKSDYLTIISSEEDAQNFDEELGKFVPSRPPKPVNQSSFENATQPGSEISENCPPVRPPKLSKQSSLSYNHSIQENDDEAHFNHQFLVNRAPIRPPKLTKQSSVSFSSNSSSIEAASPPQSPFGNLSQIKNPNSLMLPTPTLASTNYLPMNSPT